jgi:hypothetical protein
MRNCCCPYRKDAVEGYKKLYEQTYSIDLLLETMRENTRTMIERSLDADLQERVQFFPFYHSPVSIGQHRLLLCLSLPCAEYLREMDQSSDVNMPVTAAGSVHRKRITLELLRLRDWLLQAGVGGYPGAGSGDPPRAIGDAR